MSDSYDWETSEVRNAKSRLRYMQDPVGAVVDDVAERTAKLYSSPVSWMSVEDFRDATKEFLVIGVILRRDGKRRPDQ